MSVYSDKLALVSVEKENKEAQADAIRKQIMELQNQLDVLNGEIERARNMEVALEELDPTLKS